MPEIRDLDAAIRQAAESPGQRVSIGPHPTFGTRVAPVLFPALVPQLAADSLNFSSVDVALSGSAALVAAGSAKPAAATVTITPRQVQKIAGTAVLNSEAWWESQEVIASVAATLYASAVVEEDKLAVAALAAAAPAPTTATTWIGAIAAGQALVAGQGGAPGLVVVAATSWAALAGEIASSSGLTTPSADAIVSLMGSRIVISPEGVGTFVLDPSSCVHVVRDVGMLVDTASGAANNTIRVVVDLVASTFVSIPQLVVEVAKSP